MTIDHDISEATRIELPANADIRVGAEILGWCRAALEAEGDVRVACDSVERIDAAVLQCLTSLARSLRQADRRLELVEPSEPFSRTVDLLGFTALLG